MDGLDKFREAFAEYTDNYVVIGGTACDITMTNTELMTFSGFNAEHERCLTFIKNAVAQSKAANKIVVTHHVPSFRMLHPKFQGSKANGAFTVELENYIAGSSIDYWIYGHSHTNIDAKIGNTQCLSNQLGYVFANEHNDFSHDRHLII